MPIRSGSVHAGVSFLSFILDVFPCGSFDALADLMDDPGDEVIRRSPSHYSKGISTDMANVIEYDLAHIGDYHFHGEGLFTLIFI